MPRVTSENTTPELREVAFVRAIPPTPISFNQPLRGGRSRAISGRLLGETQFDGVLHHFRIEAGGVLFLIPREWVEPLPISRKKSEPARAECSRERPSRVFRPGRRRGRLRAGHNARFRNRLDTDHATRRPGPAAGAFHHMAVAGGGAGPDAGVHPYRHGHARRCVSRLARGRLAHGRALHGARPRRGRRSALVGQEGQVMSAVSRPDAELSLSIFGATNVFRSSF